MVIARPPPPDAEGGAMRWWPWRRGRSERWSTPDRIPDGDTVPMVGHDRWADLLTRSRDDAMHERTRALPPVRPLRIPPWLG